MTIARADQDLSFGYEEIFTPEVSAAKCLLRRISGPTYHTSVGGLPYPKNVPTLSLNARVRVVAPEGREIVPEIHTTFFSISLESVLVMNDYASLPLVQRLADCLSAVQVEPNVKTAPRCADSLIL